MNFIAVYPRIGDPEIRCRNSLQQYPQALELANDYAEILIDQREYKRALEVLNQVPGL